jgi:glucose-1-phosphate adenylyltransferase
VPKSQIHQFGTGITDAGNRIIDWEEKPAVPRTNLASMGIYVFDRKYLLESLARDKAMTDFGMHLLPHAIKNDRTFAYPFYGYWRDVGTIQAYWEANMDLLRPESGFSPQKWDITTNVESDDRTMDRPPARYGARAQLQNSLISAGCNIQGTVVNSVLSPGVVIEKGAIVRDSIVFQDCMVKKDAVVDLAILDKYVQVGEGAKVGAGEGHDVVNRQSPTHLYTGITVIGRRVQIPGGKTIGRNCMVNSHTYVDAFPEQNLEDGETLYSNGEVN